jgi:hypothetical protein
MLIHQMESQFMSLSGGMLLVVMLIVALSRVNGMELQDGCDGINMVDAGQDCYHARQPPPATGTLPTAQILLDR